MIDIKFIKKYIVNLIVFNFIIVFILAIFFFYLSSQGKILDKNNTVVVYNKINDNDLCNRIFKDGIRSSVNLDKYAIFENTVKDLKDNKIFSDVNFRTDFQYLDIINSAMSTNNDMLVKTRISNGLLTRIEVVFSFNTSKNINEKKINEIIQLFNTAYNNQIKIYIIQKLKKDLSYARKILENSDLSAGEILKIEDEKINISNELNDITSLDFGNLCEKKLRLNSLQKKNFLETHRIFYFTSSFLILVILNILFIIITIVKKNE